MSGAKKQAWSLKLVMDKPGLSGARKQFCIPKLFLDEDGFCANLVLERSRKGVLENRSEAGVFVC